MFVRWFNPLLGQVVPTPEPRAGEGLEVTLVHSWPWAPWITLLLLIITGAFVLFVYTRESG